MTAAQLAAALGPGRPVSPGALALFLAAVPPLVEDHGAGRCGRLDVFLRPELLADSRPMVEGYLTTARQVV